MSKVITEIPTLTLSKERVYTNANMLADIPRTLSGNALAQYVHTTGDPDIDSGTRALDSMRSPSGAFGHDHSGGNYGRPLRRSVFSYSNSFRDNSATEHSGYNEEYSTSIKQPPTNIFKVDLNAEDNSNITSSSYSIAAWIPPCDSAGAYNELSFSAKFFKIYDSNLNASDDITITVENLTTGSKASFDGGDLIASTDFMRDSNDLLACQQGAINKFRFKVNLDTVSGGSDRTLQIIMSEFNLYVNT